MKRTSNVRSSRTRVDPTEWANRRKEAMERAKRIQYEKKHQILQDQKQQKQHHYEEPEEEEEEEEISLHSRQHSNSHRLIESPSNNSSYSSHSYNSSGSASLVSSQSNVSSFPTATARKKKNEIHRHLVHHSSASVISGTPTKADDQTSASLNHINPSNRSRGRGRGRGSRRNHDLMNQNNGPISLSEQAIANIDDDLTRKYTNNNSSDTSRQKRRGRRRNSTHLNHYDIDPYKEKEEVEQDEEEMSRATRASRRPRRRREDTSIETSFRDKLTLNHHPKHDEEDLLQQKKLLFSKKQKERLVPLPSSLVEDGDGVYDIPNDHKLNESGKVKLLKMRLLYRQHFFWDHYHDKASSSFYPWVSLPQDQQQQKDQHEEVNGSTGASYNAKDENSEALLMNHTDYNQEKPSMANRRHHDQMDSSDYEQENSPSTKRRGRRRRRQQLETNDEDGESFKENQHPIPKIKSSRRKQPGRIVDNDDDEYDNYHQDQHSLTKHSPAKSKTTSQNQSYSENRYDSDTSQPHHGSEHSRAGKKIEKYIDDDDVPTEIPENVFCNHCSKSFAPPTFQKICVPQDPSSEPKCIKMYFSKRKVFSSSKARIVNNEHLNKEEQKVVIGGRKKVVKDLKNTFSSDGSARKKKKKKQLKWQEQSNTFREAMRTNRLIAKAQKEGKPVDYYLK